MYFSFCKPLEVFEFSICSISGYKSECPWGMASLVKINLSHQFNLFNVSYTCHPLIDLYILEE